MEKKYKFLKDFLGDADLEPCPHRIDGIYGTGVSIDETACVFRDFPASSPPEQKFRTGDLFACISDAGIITFAFVSHLPKGSMHTDELIFIGNIQEQILQAHIWYSLLSLRHEFQGRYDSGTYSSLRDFFLNIKIPDHTEFTKAQLEMQKFTYLMAIAAITGNDGLFEFYTAVNSSLRRTKLERYMLFHRLRMLHVITPFTGLGIGLLNSSGQTMKQLENKSIRFTEISTNNNDYYKVLSECADKSFCIIPGDPGFLREHSRLIRDILSVIGSKHYFVVPDYSFNSREKVIGKIFLDAEIPLNIVTAEKLCESLKPLVINNSWRQNKILVMLNVFYMINQLTSEHFKKKNSTIRLSEQDLKVFYELRLYCLKIITERHCNIQQQEWGLTESIGFDVLFYKLMALEQEICKKNQTQAEAWQSFMKRCGNSPEGNNYGRFIKDNSRFILNLKNDLPRLYNDLTKKCSKNVLIPCLTGMFLHIFAGFAIWAFGTAF